MSAAFRTTRLMSSGLLPRLIGALLVASMLAPSLPAIGAAQEATPVPVVNETGDGQETDPIPELPVLPEEGDDALPDESDTGEPNPATDSPPPDEGVPAPGDIEAPGNADEADPPMVNEPDQATDDPETPLVTPPLDDVVDSPSSTPSLASGDEPDGGDVGIVPLPENPETFVVGTPEPAGMMRTSASTMALTNGSVHITNYDQARNPIGSIDFLILQDGVEVGRDTTTSTGVLTIHSLYTEVDLVARQITTPAGCDPAPDQPFRIENGPPFQARLTFVNDCGGGAAGTISVVVQDQSGAPLAGVRANARYFVGPGWAGIYDDTDAAGQVTLAPVFVGYDYQVEARFLPPGCMSPPVQDVSITDTALHHSLTFISQCHDPATTGTLSINKYDHNGVSMSGITFEIFRGTTLVASGTTDYVGRFGIENIPAGSYIIRETNTPPGCIDAGDTPVNVVAGDATVIRIENDCSGSPGEITVRVVDQYGTPLPGVTFRVETVSRIHGRWTTDAAGEAVVAPLSLNQPYEIIKETGGCSGWGVELAYLDEADPQMTVTVESFCTDATPPPADLLLVKTDDLGNLLPGADFELSLDGTVVATGTTDTSGEILFPRLVRGEVYDLRETVAPEGCTASEASIPVTMPADGTDGAVTVENDCIRPLGTITITKVNQGDRPLEGVPFTIRRTGVHYSPLSTDATGTVVFENVPVGHDYIVSEREVPEGCTGAPEQTVSVTAGQLHHELTFVNDCGDDIVPGETPTAIPTPSPTAPAGTPAPTPTVTPAEPGATPDPTSIVESTPTVFQGIVTGTDTTPDPSSSAGDRAETSMDAGDDDDANGTPSAPVDTTVGVAIRSLPSAGMGPEIAGSASSVLIVAMLAMLFAVSGLWVGFRRRSGRADHTG